MDLQAILRRSFLEGVLLPSQAACPGEPFLLVLDPATRAILDLVLPTSELTILGVYGLDSIAQPRKAFPTLHCLYFLTPTPENLSLVQADFHPQRKYRSQHLYLSRRVSEALLQELGLKSFAKHLKAFREFLCDFVPLGPRSFCLSQTPVRPTEAVEGLASVVMAMDGLAAVEVLTLKDPRFPKAQAFGLGVAQKLQALLGSAPIDKRNVTAKVFIFERGTDLVTPLVHLLFYEPLVCDLLWDEVAVYPRPFGPHPARRVDQKDPVYRKYRLQPLDTVMTELSKDFESYRGNSDAAKLAESKDEQLSAQQLKRVLGEVDGFNRTIGFYNLHSENLKAILAAIAASNLQRLSAFEITIASGVNAQSDTLDLKKKTELTKELIKGNLDHRMERLRLALIAAGSLYKDIPSLTDTFEPEDRETIERFRDLVKIYGKLITKAEKSAFRELVVRKGERRGQGGRFLPKLEYLLIRYFEKKLTGDWSLKLASINKDPGNPPVKKEGLSLFRKRGQTEAQSGTEGRTAVVVHVIGGISVNEVTELEKYLGELNPLGGFLIGGDNLWNPSQYIDRFLRK